MAKVDIQKELHFLKFTAFVCDIPIPEIAREPKCLKFQKKNIACNRDWFEMARRGRMSRDWMLN
jgi:hypothetical protein